MIGVECSGLKWSIDGRQIRVVARGEEFTGEIGQEVQGFWPLGFNVMMVLEGNVLKLKTFTAFLFTTMDDMNTKDDHDGIIVDDEDIRDVIYDETDNNLWYSRKNQSVIVNCVWNASDLRLTAMAKFVVDDKIKASGLSLASLIPLTKKSALQTTADGQKKPKTEKNGDNFTALADDIKGRHSHLPTYTISAYSQTSHEASDFLSKYRSNTNMAKYEKMPDDICGLLKVSRIETDQQRVRRRVCACLDFRA